jgi:hypothetical protein
MHIFQYNGAWSNPQLLGKELSYMVEYGAVGKAANDFLIAVCGTEVCICYGLAAISKNVLWGVWMGVWPHKKIPHVQKESIFQNLLEVGNILRCNCCLLVTD